MCFDLALFSSALALRKEALERNKHKMEVLCITYNNKIVSKRAQYCNESCNLIAS